MSVSPQQWESFLRVLLDRLNELYKDGTKADVMVFMGRVDKESKEYLLPRLEIREHVMGG